MLFPLLLFRCGKARCCKKRYAFKEKKSETKEKKGVAVIIIFLFLFSGK